VVAQFEMNHEESPERRRRWLIQAQGWSSATTLGAKDKKRLGATLKVLRNVRLPSFCNAFSVEELGALLPRVVAALQPLG